MYRSLVLLGGLVLAVVSCSDGAGAPPESELPQPSVVTTTRAPRSATTATAAPATLPPGDEDTTTASTRVGPRAGLNLTLERVGKYTQPVFVTSPRGDETNLFVVDQPGRIYVADGGDGRVFLDLTDIVSFGGEQGLLGLAFHPEYADNGLFYVNYTDEEGSTVIEEYGTASDGVADRSRVRTLLRIPQPAKNHNGGMIAFGADGYLWIGMGDGGGSNDRFGLARDPESLHGSMLRLVVGPDAPAPYGVPEDNAFIASGAGRPEIWAVGLRNPWRWTFDEGRVFVADVGQSTFEEISVADTAPAGLDFGWSVLEGGACFRTDDCDRDGLVAPVYTYGREDGCSITGGVVYRGSLLPALSGHYFFSDYCQGWARSIVVDNDGAVIEEVEWPGLKVARPTSYGVDGAGEMYITSARGEVYRVVSTG